MVLNNQDQDDILDGEDSDQEPVVLINKILSEAVLVNEDTCTLVLNNKDILDPGSMVLINKEMDDAVHDK